ncbi:MAG TPA: TetR/AcrR family transcriptional regulator, partial [Polyangiaceae bacterium]
MSARRNSSGVTPDPSAEAGQLDKSRPRSTVRATADATSKPRRARKKPNLQSVPRPYGGRAPEERKQDRRERLLEAGLDLFGTIGYAQTSIERLCARAGVTTRHFYEEFGSREALLKAVYDQVIGRTMRAVRDALTNSAPQDRLFGLEAFLDCYLDDPRYGRVGSIEIVGVSPELERHRRTVIHAFAGIIESQYKQRAEAGFIKTRDFRLAAIALTGAVNELCIEALIQPEAHAIAKLKEELTHMFVG